MSVGCIHDLTLLEGEPLLGGLSSHGAEVSHGLESGHVDLPRQRRLLCLKPGVRELSD